MTNAIILTTQRTGSTFLVECLESHPQIRCLGEMLAGGHVRVPDLVYRSRYGTKAYRFLSSGAWWPTRMMTRYFASTERDVNVFKAMYNHINNPVTRNYLRARTSIHILHLRRHNLLKQYVSELLLSKSREKKWQPHAVKPVPVVRTMVSPDAALAYIRRKRELHAWHEALFADHPRLQLSYEDMIDGQSLRAEVAEEVCDFLHIERRPMKSILVKMNPTRLAEMIVNYDEVASLLRQTEFADLLD